jgi:hypothetical protein
MTLPEFKDILETTLKARTTFELLEYHYQWYCFGSGLIAYRINGFNFRLIFDGKEKELTVERSGPHEKYNGKPGKKIFSQWTLDVDSIVNEILK